MPPMSQTTKTVLAVAVVAVALAAAYFYWQQHQAAQETSTEVTSLPSGSSTSDASLEEDLASIDSQIQAAASDTADANGSVSAAAAQ